MFKLFKNNVKETSIQVANAVSCAINYQRNIFNQTLGKYFGGLRDLYKSLGYPRTITADKYINYYDRNAVAKAIVLSYPNACWSIPPEIIENEDNVITQFEKDVDFLVNDRKLFKYLKKADRMAGVLTYSVIMIGFKDGLKVDQPATGGEVAYLQSYREDSAQIDTWNNDPTSERFGKPEFYNITITNGNSSSSIKVHWSRIIHIAEDCESGDLYGTPRMESVYNNLYNIEKISGGSAEGYYRNGAGGVVAEYDKDAGIKPSDTTALDAFKSNMSRWIDGYEKSMIVKGATVKPLNINMQDPSPHFLIQIQQISAVKGIPQRKLLGSEQGKLAADQDNTSWLGIVDSRRTGFCEPDIIRPVIDRLIELKSIASPIDGKYNIVWCDLESKDDKTVSEVNKNRTEALVKYGESAQTQAILPTEQFYSMFLCMTPEEIEAIDIKADDLKDLDEKELFSDDKEPDDTNK